MRRAALIMTVVAGALLVRWLPQGLMAPSCTPGAPSLFDVGFSASLAMACGIAAWLGFEAASRFGAEPRFGWSGGGGGPARPRRWSVIHGMRH
jgi:hypothetical protein